MSLPNGPENNPEKDFSLNINVADGSTYQVNRFTTTHFTFWGRLSMFDHVFVCQEPTDATEQEEVTGAYVFNDDPSYDLLREIVTKHGFPQMLNALSVGDDDIEAYQKRHPAPSTPDDISSLLGEDGLNSF